MNLEEISFFIDYGNKANNNVSTMVNITKDQGQLTVAVTYSVYILKKKLLSQGMS